MKSHRPEVTHAFWSPRGDSELLVPRAWRLPENMSGPVKCRQASSRRTEEDENEVFAVMCDLARSRVVGVLDQRHHGQSSTA